MGEIEGWSEPNGLFLNGLLPGAESVIRSLNQDRLLKAEERIAELIACIQPNQPSEERRNAVADYVQRLITKCFPCQVFTFGSVPLKTYLPDGDIDVTAFSNNQNLKDTWANQVRDMLETEEKNEQAEFCVKEVQYIQAEVKIIKCLVENIVVDISFNQLGGLCTLCFLEEVDHLINQNHLFKRSIILIKAWCYYESRILGAPHGLISTYALETLVLYIFHVFNNSFTGPLEVLYRFLEFFGNFDWDNFCVSLWGPVPVSSLPEVTVEPPRKDGGNLLLSKLFLDACSSAYAVFPSGQENQGQPFVSKHFNVIDPLRVNNNLGRSVSKGNFYRIRSAFVFGAKTLARLLECPKENIVSEVNKFFTTTWERHGSGQRPDAPRTNTSDSKLSTTSDHPSGSDNFTKYQVGKPNNIQGMSRKSDLSTSSLSENHTRVSRHTTNHGAHEHGNNGRFMFARTNSSPELVESYNDLSSRARRHRPREGVQTRNTSIRLDDNNKKNSYRRGESGSDAVNQELISSTVGGTQEEQDLVNMMGSTSLHHFNGQVPFPYDSLSPHSPFPIHQSFLASLRYTQQNMPTLAPLNVSNLQFPHGFVPQPLANHIQGIGFNSNLEHSSEKSNEKFGSMEVNSAEPENGFGQDHEVGSLNGGFETENSSRDMFPSWQNGYETTSEKCVDSQRGHLDDYEFQNIGTEVYYEERTTSSRFPSASYRNFQRSSTPESSSDGSSERLGKKVALELPDDKYGKDKIMTEHEPNHVVENDEHVWNAQSNKGAEIVGAQPVDLLHQGSTRGSEPTLPVPPLLVGSDSWPRGNPDLIPFYPTGPPVPFLMLPVYDTSETGALDNDTSQNFDSTSDEHRLDILSSDFASHFQNLQYGRFCQNPPHPGPMFYQTPFMVPLEYLQGRIPWDNSSHGRPRPTNSNLLTQLMGYGSRVVPVSPLSPVSSRPPNVYQPFAGDLPKHRSGTGTYFPNPKISVRDRQPSNARRGNYNYDRNDSHGGVRDGNWNMNSKPRASSRAYNRSQTEKLSVSRYDRLSSNENRADRSWEPNRNESFFSFHSENASLRANSSIGGGPSNVSYGLYHSNGPNVPPVLMGYPFEHDGCSGSLSGGEQLEFGSLGPIGGVGGVNDSPHTSSGSQARGSQFDEHRSREASSQRPSSGQPSSPHHRRRS